MIESILKRNPIPCLIAGEWRDSSSGKEPHRIIPFLPDEGPFPGNRPFWEVVRPGPKEVLETLSSLEKGQGILSSLPKNRLRRILETTGSLLEAHRAFFAHLITQEVGKPKGAALFEVDRAISTFRIAASCTDFLGSSSLPGDRVPQGSGMIALVDRVSLGPVLAITPYNFPLNLLAHKVAPAIATGSAVVVKPAPLGMTTAIALAALLLEAGLPPESLSVLPCDIQETERLIEHPALPVISFTGSATVGWSIRDRVPRKKVLLELGGTAAVVVFSDGDLPDLPDRLITGTFAYSGQICISIQRILVARPLYEFLREELRTRIRNLERDNRIGSLSSPGTLMGPLIRKTHADEVRRKIEEAVTAGAGLLAPIRQEGALLYPTILTGTGANWPIEQEEVFGPVATLNPFDSVEEAIDRVNRSRYGIQTGLFTRSIDRALALSRRIDTGGVLINEIPTFRLDHWPYGGVKESGTGFEGVPFAMDEMTRPRMVAIRIPSL